MDDPLTAISGIVNGVQSYNSDTFPVIIDVNEEDIAVVFVNADSGEA